MTFSAAKTEAIVFTHKHGGSLGFPSLRMGTRLLPFSDSVRYLGVILDSKLNFKEHITNQSKKAKRLLMAARGTLRKQCGPSPAETRWIYEAMVKPVVLYGSIVWGHKVSKDFKPFIRLQRLALMCMGYPRTVCWPRYTRFSQVPYLTKFPEKSGDRGLR